MQSARHIATHTPAMIVLSDGQNTTGRDPLAAAAAAKADGIHIITIGLGEDADAALLIQIASSPDSYYYAPSAEALAAIYQAIAGELRCRP